MPPNLALTSLTLDDVLAIVARRWVTAVLVGGAIALGMLVLLFGSPPLYEAKATLQAVTEAKAIDFTTTSDASDTVQLGMLNAQREVLLSDQVLRQTVAASGLGETAKYRRAEDPVAVLRDRMRVLTSKDNWTIAVILRDEDPQRAQAALRVLLDAFLATHDDQQRRRGTSNIRFLDNELADSERKLQHLRDERQSFADTNGLISVDAKDNFIATRLTEQIIRHAGIDAEVAAAESIVRQVEAARAIAEADARRPAFLHIAAIAADATVSSARIDLSALETEAAKLGQKYGPRHPRMIEITEQIASKHAQLDAAIAVAQAGLVSDLAAKRDRLRVQADLIAETQNHLSLYQRNLAELKRRDALVETQEALHQQLLTRIGEERVSSKLDTVKVNTLDEPRASTKPVTNRPLLAMLVIVLGLIGAIAGAVGHDLLDQTIHRPEDIAATTGKPVLASIPAVESPPLPTAAARSTDQRGFLEAIRDLRTALRLSKPVPGCQTLVVTSSGPGEGSSLIAAHLAVSLAATGLRTLLIDGDLRSPQQHNLFAVRPGSGFSHLLAGEPGVSPIPTAVTGLDLLIAGPRPPNPAELLHSHCLEEWLATCKHHYQYIIFDAPAVGAVSDALVIAAHCDRILLTVRRAQTTRSDLNATIAALDPLIAKVVGTIFNGSQVITDLAASKSALRAAEQTA